MPCRGRKGGIVFQRYSVFPRLSVLGNAVLGLELTRAETAGGAGRVKRLANPPRRGLPLGGAPAGRFVGQVRTKEAPAAGEGEPPADRRPVGTDVATSWTRPAA